MKFTDYLSRNPVRGATPDDNYVEEYLSNIVSEQARIKLKYGYLSADQSNDSKHVTEANNGTSESKSEQQNNQSQSNKTFQKKNGVNNINRSEKNTTGQSDIRASKSSCILEQHSNTIQKKKVSISNPEITEMTEIIFTIGAQHARLWK